jgi:hypothetical protein
LAREGFGAEAVQVITAPDPGGLKTSGSGTLVNTTSFRISLQKSGFNDIPSILRHSGIGGAADEALSNKELYKNNFF